MAELATLARPYANAVFQISKGSSELDAWSRMLEFLSVASGDPQLKRLLDAPDVAEAQKALRLTEVCGEELTEHARQFVMVLAANKRLPLISEIAAQFEVLRSLEQQSLDVEIVSAFSLSDDEADSLREALGRKFGKEVQLTSRVDESLIGGAVIRAGDTVIDGSVRGKLDKLAETIQRT